MRAWVEGKCPRHGLERLSYRIQPDGHMTRHYNCLGVGFGSPPKVCIHNFIGRGKGNRALSRKRVIYVDLETTPQELLDALNDYVARTYNLQNVKITLDQGDD